MIILLDGEKMKNKADTHRYLKKRLDLPSFYGNNLDALWDILTTKSDNVDIVLYNHEAIYENMGDYGKSLVDVLNEAAIENKKVSFKVASIRIIR